MKEEGLVREYAMGSWEMYHFSRKTREIVKRLKIRDGRKENIEMDLENGVCSCGRDNSL
jgi:hypothetical protein